jgi:hypothetical protein
MAATRDMAQIRVIEGPEAESEACSCDGGDPVMGLPEVFADAVYERTAVRSFRLVEGGSVRRLAALAWPQFRVSIVIFAVGLHRRR